MGGRSSKEAREVLDMIVALLISYSLYSKEIRHGLFRLPSHSYLFGLASSRVNCFFPVGQLPSPEIPN